MPYLTPPTSGVNRRDQTATTDTALLEKLNVAVKAANEAETTVTTAQAELVSRSKAVGLLLLEAKKLHPAVKDFEAFLKRVDGLKLSRAYDLLRLAGGRATDEEIRKATRDRVKKHRAKKLPNPRPTPKPAPEPLKLSVTSTPVTESREISIDERKAQHTELAEEEVLERAASALGSKHISSAYALNKFTQSCRTWLPLMTEADQKKARQLVAKMTAGTPKAEAA